jgi:hypothetical protein
MIGDGLIILPSGIAVFSPPRTIIFDNPALPNNGIATFIGSFPVNQSKTYFIQQTYTFRDGAGNLLTVSHRVSIKGDPAAPSILADQLQSQVSNLPALPITTNAIAGTDMTLTITNPVLSGGPYAIRVYNQIFIGV